MTATGLKKNTKDSTFRTLRRLNKETDLMNPEAVKLHIGKLKKKNGEPLENSSKQKIANNYDYFVQANQLQWEKPIYKYDTKIPITPTREQAEAIISSAPTLNAATIFRILLESGFEGEELHNTTEKDIDTEQGIITVAGTKGHNGRLQIQSINNRNAKNIHEPTPQNTSIHNTQNNSRFMENSKTTSSHQTKQTRPKQNTTQRTTKPIRNLSMAKNP